MLFIRRDPGACEASLKSVGECNEDTSETWRSITSGGSHISCYNPGKPRTYSLPSYQLPPALLLLPSALLLLPVDKPSQPRLLL